MAYTVFDAVAKFSADSSQLDDFIVKLEQGLTSASEKAAAATLELKDAQEEFRASIAAVSAEGGDTAANLQRLADAEKNLALSAAAARQEHAALKDSLLGARDASTSFGAAAGGAAEKMGYSFREARGSIMLVTEEIGVHLPRELTMLLAHIPMVGAAFSLMLPLVGVFAAIKVIGDLIDKHMQHAAALRHVAEASEGLEIKQRDMVEGLKAANLQLEDQIRKLEGRPAVNTLVIAMMAVKKNVDDLAAAYANDFQKMDKTVEEHLGFWEALKRNAIELALVFDEVISAGIGTHGETAKRVQGDNEEVAALKVLITAQEQLQKVRAELSETDPSKDIDKWRLVAGAAATAAGHVQAAADAAIAAVKKVEPNATELLAVLADKATTAKGEWQSMAEKIKEAGAAASKAIHEMANERAEKQATAAKRALDEQIADINVWAEEQERASLKAEHGAGLWAAAQVHAADLAAAAHEAYGKKLVEIYTRAGEVEKAQEEQAKLDVLLKADQTEALKKLDEGMRKYTEDTLKLREKFLELQTAGVEKYFLATQKAAEGLTKAYEDVAKAQTKLAEDKLAEHYKDEEAAITKLAQMHLITEEQKDDRLKLLEQQQANAALAILQHQLDQEQAAMQAAQTKVSQMQLTQVHPSPLFSDAQLADLKKNLDQALLAFSQTDAALKTAQSNARAAVGNPFYTDADRADLDKKLAETTADFAQAQAKLNALKAQADRANASVFVTPAQVAEDKKNLDAATAAYVKAQAEIEALHKQATGAQFFTEADKAALLKRIEEAEAAFQAAQTVMAAAQKKVSADNAFIPNAEVEEAQANAKKLEAVVVATQAMMVAAQEKFNQQSEQNDKSRYGRALLEAMAFGKEILAEELKQNHQALVAAEGELKQAKARGENTDALHKEIAALKDNEKALEKEAAGGKVTQTEKQKNIQTAITAAETLVAEAKARGANTIALEQQVRAMQQLATLQDKDLITNKHQSDVLMQQNKLLLMVAEAKLKLAQADVLVTAEGTKLTQADVLETAALEKQIQALKQQQQALQQEAQELPKVSTAMVGLEKTTQQLGQMTQKAGMEMDQAFVHALMGAMQSGKSIGAALEAATKQVLDNLAEQAAAQAIYCTAMGIAELALGVTSASAAEWFAAAAEFGLLAGAAGAVGMAIPGAHSGAGAATPISTTGGSSTVGGGGPTTVGVAHLAAGGLASAPTLVVVGDSKSGGSGKEAILPLEDNSAMGTIGDAIAGSMLRSLFESSLPPSPAPTQRYAGDATSMAGDSGGVGKEKDALLPPEDIAGSLLRSMFFDSPMFDSPFPRLAEGGVATAPSLVVVGDSKSGGAGKEAILPLEDPGAMGTIGDAIADSMRDSMLRSMWELSLPRMTDGGVVLEPTFLMAGDGPFGQAATEAILPLSDPAAMAHIVDAFARTPQQRYQPDATSALLPQRVLSLAASASDAERELAVHAGASSGQSRSQRDAQQIAKALAAALDGKTPLSGTIGVQSSQPSDSGGDTHNHFHAPAINLRGSPSSDAKRIAKELNRQVKKGMVHLKSSDSFRKTPRSQ